MEDKQLRILVLTKLYQHNRQGASIKNFTEDKIFEGVDEKQFNFCYQYLGTQNLIEYESSGGGGLWSFSPLFIKGQGMDIVESLISKISDKIKNSLIKNTSSVIEKIPIFLAESLTNLDLWDAAIQIFDKLIQALSVVLSG